MGAVFSPPIQETQIVPEVVPMRRGRPGKSPSQITSAKPSPSPFRGPSTDPFAALDTGVSKNKNADELSHRYPMLDHFQLLQDTRGKVDFDRTPAGDSSKAEEKGLPQRLTNALADDAFAKRQAYAAGSVRESPMPSQSKKPYVSVMELNQRESPKPGEHVSRQQTPLYQPVPQKPAMVSTGTMTSPSVTPVLPEQKPSSNILHKFTRREKDSRPSSLPRGAREEKSRIPSQPNYYSDSSNYEESNANNNHANAAASSPPSTLSRSLPKSFPDRIPHVSESVRPSLEGTRESSRADADGLVSRSRSVNSRPRPLSVYGSTPQSDFSERVEHVRASLDLPRPHFEEEDEDEVKGARTGVDGDYDAANITSDVDYLRAREGESDRKRDKRPGDSKHKRGASLGKSIPGTKLLSGRFGEAFRRFEGHDHKNRHVSSPAERRPAQVALVSDSEATQLPEDEEPEEDTYDDYEEGDDISPEMRRELERRQQSQEEKRVANAAAEHRRLVAERGPGNWRTGTGADNARSSNIQNRVQTLLQESDKVPSTKTAAGYGRYTDAEATATTPRITTADPTPARTPELGSEQQPNARQAAVSYAVRNGRVSSPAREGADHTLPDIPQQGTGHVAAAVAAAQHTAEQKPALPPRPAPKPKSLRAGGAREAIRPSSHDNDDTYLEDYETSSFGRRYPSLSKLEMVETEIKAPKMPSVRTREV